MSTMDKCPFCGAVRNGEIYKCGSVYVYDIEGQKGIYRPSVCYERQIAQLQERLEAWREFGRKSMDYINSEWDHYGDPITLQKLKDLGEILMTDQKLVKWAAEKVMEAEWRKVGGRYGYFLPNGNRFPSDWNPTHDANHRDMFVERMRELGWKISIDDIGNGWNVDFLIPEEERIHSAFHRNLGHAVLLAAHKALEGEK